MTLPTSFDLKPYADEIEAQGDKNSCLAQATCSAIELMHKRIGNEVQADPMPIWTALKVLRGDSPTDNVGTDPKYLPQVLNDQYGYTARKIGPHEVKRFIQGGYPVIYSGVIDPAFFELKGDWRTHTYGKRFNTSVHSVLIIGWDDNCPDGQGRFLCENSFSAAHGDGGFVGMPYDVFMALHPMYVIDGIYPSDLERTEAIKAYVGERLKEVKDAAAAYSVTNREIDFAMGWDNGQWAKVSL